MIRVDGLVETQVAVEVRRKAPRDARAEALFLSLRSCATHTAGPLRAVASLAEAVEVGEISEDGARVICDDVAARFRSMSTMPGDRLAIVTQFLSVLFT